MNVYLVLQYQPDESYAELKGIFDSDEAATAAIEESKGTFNIMTVPLNHAYPDESHPFQGQCRFKIGEPTT